MTQQAALPTALSGDAPTVRLSHYLSALPATHSIAVFVGAMARGRDDFADGVVDEKISISEYALSASVACGKVSPSVGWFLIVLIGGACGSFVVRWRTSGMSCE
jgi:rRNA pseudouridine-1189 N-methylase Emg1 (Nep1/Mra1 family)